MDHPLKADVATTHRASENDVILEDQLKRTQRQTQTKQTNTH